MTAPRLRPATPPRRRLGDLADAFALTATTPGPWRAVTVAGVAADHRTVAPGALFAGHAGGHVHGAAFAAEAVARGAAAVLTDPAGADRLAGEPLGVPVLLAPDVPAILGALAAELYGHPGTALRTFAVTGTNGKTTTTYMLDHALRALGRRTGLVGTVELRVGAQVAPATLTTPQPADLQAMLAAMVEAGVQDVVLEVSSHALALGRVEPLVADVAGFTNLTQDHLDFHADLEDYFAAKASLFTPARSRAGVTLVDDAWGARLAARGATGVSLTGAPAPWQVTDRAAAGPGTAFTLRGPGGTALRTSTALPGEFNVANAALAAVMLLTAGVPAADLTAALDGAGGLSPRVPGRMELLADRPRVVVDFAHNPDALAKALTALRPTTAGRLHVLVGAAGERDRGKRPAMGRLAAELADTVVITDDDPHDEPAAQIRAEVRAGAETVSGATVVEVADRAQAIRTVVRGAAATDTVLVAGRGHETVQEVGGVAHHLDDREEVRAALAERTGGHR
ncbi:UDP-N-acetylmuramoyl-L-alanyl-D-glutamate--2,6-diaminopimelate ligase [Georgenia sp. TF02-10]|uniref:UDP-N-acetylmuramoyl-L-alanyl-D-glutamate--2, 6-diaminopimelate ligase n=1 Tax=Georgenia sp. TF02-10 TaxID=2917725 RepID=UPI001FA7A193|nr:UDP-N-acetylmuramoyl-L-alanyl-D-glutamate--2,6-diaminopimelate ligase [Georgenia sp. TF02-10]UNX55975.1 UDP-N-acetylmuramoyl-L-alanyl-D-glutamate--2,6-diaminopimelate ligase [Georgenia sp. TF02-10]